MSLKKAMEELLKELHVRGFIDQEVLEHTPERYTKALYELLNGYYENPNSHVVLFENREQTDIIYATCEFYSLCEHHCLPFFGKVHIAYAPTDKIIGLSKLGRIVDVFARRLQVQERLTNQIADFLFGCDLKPRGVFILVEGKHLCMIMRGIKKQDAITKTVAVRGCFAEGEEAHRKREEVLMILRERGVIGKSEKE